MKKRFAYLILVALSYSSLLAQFNPPTSCTNLDFSKGNFDGWLGNTSVYPPDWPDAKNCVSDNSNPKYVTVTCPKGTGKSCNGCFSLVSTKPTALSTAGKPLEQSGVPVIPPYLNTGIVPGRHTIMSQQGVTDPFTCGNVQTIPPGERYAARLGNGGRNPNPSAGDAWTRGVDYEWDYLSYTYVVSPSSALLIYKYAIVLQDPLNDPNNAPHTETIRPLFSVTVKDAQDSIIGKTCGKFDAIYTDTIAGFRTCDGPNWYKLGARAFNPVGTAYRSWTTVGVDLRPYIGQSITLQFLTKDCGWGGHFGYAYVNARCDAFVLKSKSCSGDVTVSAPDGFSYKWFPNKETTKDIILKGVPESGAAVSVELTSVTGCKSSITTTVYPTVVTASFTASEKSVCMNKKITFKNLSKSYDAGDNSDIPITQVRWVFGDGSDTVKTTDAVHSYTAPGNYTAKVMVVSERGCTSEYEETFNVQPGPTANFDWSDACVDKFIQFTNLSKVDAPQTITSYTWSYNGNTVNTKDAVGVKYNTGGVYTVTLGVTSTSGCTHDTIKPIRLWKLPMASFKANSVCVGEPTKFSDISIVYDADAKNTTWAWDFGDDTPKNSVQNSTHTYQFPGSYSVTLTVETDSGCFDDSVVVVVVNDKPLPNFLTTSACLGAPTVFTDMTPVSQNITAWAWNFDDKGATSTSQNPAHTYTNTAKYNPTLTVVTKDGCVGSISHPLALAPLPDADFDSDKYKGCAPLAIQFFDLSFAALSADSIVKWDWSFGDGGTASTQTPAHVYQNPGVYSVSLTITTAGGCTATHNWPAMIEAFDYPKANFEPSPAETTDDLPEIKFTNLSIDNASDYWYLGINDVTSELRNPIYSYPEPGTYDITLKIKNKNGCPDQITKQIVVKPTWSFYIPNAFSPDITGGVNDGFNGVAVNITDYQMWIFDRWGEKVYYTDDINKPWNGYKDNLIRSGDLKIVKQDVYVWKVKFRDSKGKLHERIGHVTALR